MDKLTRRRFIRDGAALTPAGLLKRGISRSQSTGREADKRSNILWITVEDTYPQLLG